MKRLASISLLFFSLILCARSSAQIMSVEEGNRRAAQKQAKIDKTYKKNDKKRAQLQKKYDKAQLKAAQKSNRKQTQQQPNVQPAIHSSSSSHH